MKKFYLLTKTLLVAALLMVGATNAWGATTWKTYKTWDFITGFAASDVSGLLPEGSWTTSGSGTSTVAEVTTTISSATAVTTTVNNRYYGIKLHANADKMQLASDGICLLGTASYVTIPNLKTGQRVTVIIDNANGVEVYSGSVATLTGVATTSSDSYYKTVGIVGTGGDLTIKRYGGTTFRIRSILVETPIVDAVYTQEFTGVTEKPADWTINAGTVTFDNNMKITHPSDANSRNGFLNISSSVSSLTNNNWTLTFKTAITAASGTNSQSGQEIAVWGSNSSYTSGKSYKVSGNKIIGSRINDNNAFFQAYNTTVGGTTYTVLIEGTNMGTVDLGSATEYIYTVHCTDINTSSNTANLQVIIVKAGTGAEVFNKTRSINTATTGTLGGIFYQNARYNSVTTFDDIYLTQSVFTLGESSKTVDIADNGTVSVTGISGNISVVSANTAIATASYSDGSVTINGVAKGTTTITVYCSNNGVTTSKTIDVTVRGYDELYAEEKAPYDSKVENLDAAGQAYWTANVTDPATVTTSETYATAVAALPTTYVAAVKAQGAGSDMTDAMPTGNAGWTCAQGNGPASYLTTGATETYSDGTNNPKFVAGNIMSQTISDLQNGYYSVQFYGVVNAANSVSMVSGSDLVQAYANATDLDIDVVLQNSCTPTDYLRTIEAQVTDGSLTYGLKAKEGVEDAGNWAVAKILKLTYLGTEKKTYTINAVAGETVIKELATGSEWPSDTYGVYVPKVILYNSKYYVLDDPNMSNYYASYIMGATDVTNEINYTLDESIVAYAEAGSNISQSTSNNASYSSGNYGHVDGKKSISLGTLGAGTYEFAAYYVSNSNRGLYLRNGNIADISTNTIVSQTLSSAGMVYANFQLTSSTPILFTGYTNEHSQYNQSAEFDFIFIRKTGEVATINSTTGYATFSSTSPVNVDVEGLEAYIATGKNGDYITMEQVTGDVAANTGLVLKGTTGITYDLPIVATGDTPDGNLLQPCDGSWTTLSKSNTGTNYVLSEQGTPKVAVFAPIGNTSATLRAGSAYLYIEGVSLARALRFSFGGITGVENVEAAEATAKKNGAYLENGKIAIYKNGMKYNANGQLIK